MGPRSARVHTFKYGGGYFITHDRRMLDKRHELKPLTGPALAVVTLEEFLAAYDRFTTAGRSTALPVGPLDRQPDRDHALVGQSIR